MDVVATVKILKNNFDEWLSFFKIYEHLRNGFATNEVAYKYSKLDLWVFKNNRYRLLERGIFISIFIEMVKPNWVSTSNGRKVDLTIYRHIGMTFWHNSC